jgi:hypothetical protein
MIVVPVQKGQSIFDISLQEYGDVAYVHQLLKDNENLNLNSNVGAGDVIYIDNTIKGEPTVKAYFQELKRQGRYPVNVNDFDGGSYNLDYNNDYDISN